jgi:hypothetical protein
MFRMPSRHGAEDAKSPRKPPPNYFSRRQQKRLLLLVGMFMVVVIITMEAARPDNWRWFARLNGDESSAADPEDSEQGEAIDTTMEEPPSDRPSNPYGAVVTQTPRNDEEFDADREYFAGVDPRLLSEVTDRTRLVPDQARVMHHLLAVLNKASLEEIEAASEGNVTFLQLYRQPEEYRGRIVTIKGQIRRAFRVEFDDKYNEFGFDGYWKLWVFYEGDSRMPIVVYALDMPEGFKAREKMSDDIELTGFSFKVWPYYVQESGKWHTAPIVLTKYGHWTPEAEKPMLPITILGMVLAIAGAAAIGVVIAVVVYNLNRRSSPTTEIVYAAGKRDLDELNELKKQEFPDVGEKLRDLETKENEQ